MKRVIVTSHEGEEFDRIAAMTLPRIARYAERHGVAHMDVVSPRCIERPPSWKKLVAICEGFVEHEEVLWVDADVLVVNEEHNVFEAVPACYSHAMVRHVTNEGDVPNAGVWLVRRKLLPVISTISMMDAAIHHRWWEQAALLSLMGFVESQGQCVHVHNTLLYEETAWMCESWNTWRGSPSGVSPRFRHACGLTGTERLAAIESWIDRTLTKPTR